MKKYKVILSAVLACSVVLGGCSFTPAEPDEAAGQEEQQVTTPPEVDLPPAIEIPDYTEASSEDYGAGDTKGHSWRLIVNPEISLEELGLLVSVFDDDKYSEITIWCYSSSEAVEAGLYDVAMIERGSDGVVDVTLA